jgi:hypothetical protein
MDNFETFKKQGYVLVTNTLSREMLSIAEQYTLLDEYQDLSLEESSAMNNPQIHNSHSKYADPLMESLLLYYHSLIEENTGLQLFPTYSYYRVYRPGAHLKKHKDRPSCEISATLCLGYDYKNQAEEYEYPIFMNGTPYILKPGDLVIYRGCDLDHWRDIFEAPPGSHHSQVFLHYVDKNGPYSDYKWDQRPYIGYKGRTSKTNIPNKSYIQYTK